MIILLVLVVCFGSVIYTSVSGSSSPITVAVGTVATPVQKAITWVADRFVGVYNFIFRYQDALDENEQLKEEIRDLEQQLRDAQYAVDENESLRQMLEIKERKPGFSVRHRRGGGPQRGQLVLYPVSGQGFGRRH